MEPNKNKKLIDLGILSEDEATGVKKVSLVEEPAIELDFRYFKKENFEEITCSCGWKWDLAEGGQDPYICHKCGMDNNPVLDKFESFNDYPESAKNAAKRALEIRDKNPDLDCGTAVGWTRANQLAKGENISEDTIARMASFARHKQNSEGNPNKDCGALMWLCWGGTSGINWASNKLKEIRSKDFDINTAGLTPYVDPGVKKKKDLDKYEDWSKDEYIVETVLALADQLGTKLEDLHTRFNKEFANASLVGPGVNPAIAQNSPYKAITLYKYEGAISNNSRDFCVQMVSRDLFYSREDLVALSNVACNPGFGRGGANEYSIWKFKGGPNCKHAFRKYTVVATENSNSPHVIDEGWAPDRPGRKPEDMANSGYISARHSAFKFASDDQMIICGPAMIPNISIPRIDADGERYFVKFSEETIKEIAMKYFKEARTNDVNTDHEENEAGAYIFESWIVEDPATDKANTIYGYDVPKGSWMLKMKVDNKDTWNRIKEGSLKGFSIEGILMDLEELEARKKYERILNILK